MVAGNLARKMNTAPEPEVHISESPIKWCSVSLSDMISRGKRLEASVFDVEAKQAVSYTHLDVYKRQMPVVDWVAFFALRYPLLSTVVVVPSGITIPALEAVANSALLQNRL